MENKIIINLLKGIPENMIEPVLISFLLRILKQQPDKIKWLKEQIEAVHIVNLKDNINKN